MANQLFNPGREGFLDGNIDWDTDDIRVMLVLNSYTIDATDKFIADLGAVDNGRSAALGTKTVADGVADAGDTSLVQGISRARKRLEMRTSPRVHRSILRMQAISPVRKPSAHPPSALCSRLLELPAKRHLGHLS